MAICVKFRSLANIAYGLWNSYRPNPEYAALFDKAENTESIEEVSKLIARLSEEINKKSIVIPLHERRPNYFLSNKISEVGVTDNAWALNVDNIKVKSK